MRPPPAEPVLCWELRRNCALSPRQLAVALALPAAATLPVAAWFAVLGYPLVLLFALLELAGGAWAFLAYARHACDRDLVVLREDRLTITVQRAGRADCFDLQAAWARVDLPAGGAAVTLSAGGRTVQVARLVSPPNRLRFARELLAALHLPARSEPAIV